MIIKSSRSLYFDQTTFGNIIQGNKGITIIEYIGEKITKAQSDKIAEIQLKKAEKNKDEGQVYIFTLNDKYDINGNVSYNKARLMNHSCDPNCDTDIIDNKIWIRSFRDIRKGQELTYDYGFGYDEDYKQFPCRCRAKNCCGYIVRSESRWRISKKFKKSSRINK